MLINKYDQRGGQPPRKGPKMKCKCGLEINRETSTIKSEFHDMGNGDEAIDVQVTCNNCDATYFSFVELKNLILSE